MFGVTDKGEKERLKKEPALALQKVTDTGRALYTMTNEIKIVSGLHSDKDLAQKNAQNHLGDPDMEKSKQNEYNDTHILYRHCHTQRGKGISDVPENGCMTHHRGNLFVL